MTVNPSVTDQLIISQAEASETLVVSSFLKSESNTILKNHYDTGVLNKIKLESTQNTKGIILSAPSKHSEYQSLNFIMDNEGNLETVFESFGFFDEMGNLVSYLHFVGTVEQDIAYIDFTDGHREFLSKQYNYSNSRANSWWNRFDKCAGSFNSPTNSNVGNIVFAAVANSVTLGIYTPASLLLCGIAATASSDPPRVSSTSSKPNIRDLRVNWVL